MVPFSHPASLRTHRLKDTAVKNSQDSEREAENQGWLFARGFPWGYQPRAREAGPSDV